MESVPNEAPKGHAAAGNNSGQASKSNQPAKAEEAKGNNSGQASKSNQPAKAEEASAEPPAANQALAECNIKCVPSFSKINDRSVKKNCSKNLYNAASCLLEREKERSFYDSINWDTLVTNLPGYLSLLEKKIKEDEVLAEEIQRLYTYGPHLPQSSKYADILIVPNTTRDDYKYCKDLIIKISINRGAVQGKQRQVIAHISLHPKLPKYYRNTLRSRNGCGYFTKKNANNGESDSPFQYVIESVKWRSIEFKFTNPLRPYLPIFADTAHPGKFLPLAEETNFPFIDTETFPDGPGKPPSMTEAEKTLLKSIHKKILDHFIDLWNTTLQVGTATLPKVRRNLGGSRRRTRKIKPSRK